MTAPTTTVPRETIACVRDGGHCSAHDNANFPEAARTCWGAPAPATRPPMAEAPALSSTALARLEEVRTSDLPPESGDDPEVLAPDDDQAALAASPVTSAARPARTSRRRDDASAAPAHPPIAGAALRDLPLDAIDVGDNVRVAVDELEELAASIAEHGVLQPIKVTGPLLDRYTVVWGQRRTLAARMAGLERIPAIVLPPEAEVRVHGSARSIEQLVENLHRADLNPIDRARAMREVVDGGISQADLARKLGIAPSTVANDLRLLETAPKVQELLAAGSLTPAHVKAIAGLGHEDQAELAAKAVDRHTSAHDLEREAKWAKDQAGERQRRREATAKHTKDAIALLEKVANRRRSTIGVPNYAGSEVAELLRADGWKVVKDGWSIDVVKEPGACGCAGVWCLEVPYGTTGKVELKPGCNSDEHKKARQAEREAEWARERERHANERDEQAKATAGRQQLLAERLEGILGTPFGQRLVLYALAADNNSIDDNLIDAYWDGDREAVYDLDDTTWALLEKVPDDQLGRYITLALAEALTSWNAGPGVEKAIDEYFAPAEAEAVS